MRGIGYPPFSARPRPAVKTPISETPIDGRAAPKSDLALFEYEAEPNVE